MNVVVDTSAFLALLDASEQNHEHAERIWGSLSRTLLFCTTRPVETTALVQKSGLSSCRLQRLSFCASCGSCLYNAG